MALRDRSTRTPYAGVDRLGPPCHEVAMLHRRPTPAPPVTIRDRSVADLVADPHHAGPLSGADAAGEACDAGRRLVRIAVWVDGSRVTRARFRATTCASLLAFAEAACALLERGVAPGDLGAALRAAVRGVHPDHRARADLVLSAARAALSAARERT